MADLYTWNIPHSPDRVQVNNFLRIAAGRIMDHPDKVPFDKKTGILVLSWMTALMDRKPSELHPTPTQAHSRLGD